MLKAVPVLLTLLASLVPGAAADPPQLSAYFSNPSITGATDNSLQTKLEELIDLAAPGSTLRAATYQVELPSFTDKLVAASRRGADVHVVVEGDGRSAEVDRLANALPGRVTLCDKGCNNGDDPANQDVMHHKFFVFSRLTDGRTEVVAQSSKNVSHDHGLHQNMIISSGDVQLANGYRTAFETLKGRAPYSWSAPFTSADGKVTVWMQPRNTAYDAEVYKNSDLVAAMIDDVICAGGGRIRVAHSQFAKDRQPVIDALTAKKKDGCAIEIIVQEGNATVDVGKLLAPAGIVIHTMRPGGCHYPAPADDPAVKPCGLDGIHSKIMLVEGGSAAAGGAFRRYVYTGSHNLNYGSLSRANDSFVRIENPDVYAAYDADFTHMMEEVIKFVPSSYPQAAVSMVANGPTHQRGVRAAAARDGSAAVVWEEGGSSSSATGTEVWARVYDHGRPQAVVRVSGAGAACSTGWNHVQPSVGVDDDGNAYIAWAEDGDCRGEHNIAVRRLARDGTLSGTVWANSGTWSGDQVRPRIAVGSTGAFTVVWEDGGTVRAAGYSSQLARVFGPSAVSAGDRPDVAMDGAGNATVVWQQAPDVYGKRLSSGGATVAGPTKINVNSATQHLAPAVASTSDGRSVVTWSDNLDEIWRIRIRGFTPTLGQRFSERAAAYGLYGKGATGSDKDDYEYPPLCYESSCAVQGSPSIATSDDGRFVVGWNETDRWNAARNHEVYARGFDALGNTAGAFPPKRMNPNTFGMQYGSALTAGSSGFTYFYVEEFDNNGYSDIVARTGFTNTSP
ncbi:phospholipase D-like domain-containing protein [Nonomuraea dietziae]|uniref:phospholipase D-like domain-containing protein n=1 Tax=Nonomuraea dietziae TaxID=65515 RepID=UPI00342D2FD8